MHGVREFEAVVIDHALGQRRAHQLPAGGGADERAERRMARAEITGVGERGRMTRRLEPPLHPVMAVGAEFLRRRRHRSRAFMLGMALDAAPLRLVEGLGEARENLFARRSEEHTSELQSLMRISYAVFCL